MSDFSLQRKLAFNQVVSTSYRCKIHIFWNSTLFYIFHNCQSCHLQDKGNLCISMKCMLERNLSKFVIFKCMCIKNLSYKNNIPPLTSIITLFHLFSFFTISIHKTTAVLIYHYLKRLHGIKMLGVFEYTQDPRDSGLQRLPLLWNGFQLLLRYLLPYL